MMSSTCFELRGFISTKTVVQYLQVWHSMSYIDMIYLLTAIGLSPGGSSTVHIYTETIYRTTQNLRRVRAVPRLV